LLKNYLFSLAGKDKLAAVQQNWAEMKGALEALGGRDDHTANYIRHLWISRNGPARDRQLYKLIKGKVKGVEPAAELSTDLATNAANYSAILSSKHSLWAEYSEGMRDYIDALNTLGVKRLRPLLLSILTRFDEGKKAKKESLKAFKLMVSWSVRFLVAGPAAGTVEEHLGHIAKEVYDKKVTTARDS
jgi:hypothetical protein